MQKIMSLHLSDIRLTPELVAVLGTISEQYEKPTLRVLADKTVGVYVPPWKSNLY